MLRKTFSTLVMMVIVAAQFFAGWQPAVFAGPPAPQPEGGMLPVAEPASSLGLTNPIHLKSRTFTPAAPEQAALEAAAASPLGKKHVLVQLDFIPGQKAKDELARRGLRLLAYIPDYAWIAALDSGSARDALALPGMAWVGELQLNDKLDEAIRLGQWSSFNRKADGTVAVYVMLHQDEGIEHGRSLVAKHGGKLISATYGINLLVVEMPEDKVSELAAEEAVQWIEPAAPALQEDNDGLRGEIGVNTVQAAPYNLNGSGVDVLVYDGGDVDASHADFAGRIWAAGDQVISDHSTHVAGTIGGSGANSASSGGSANQWKGMAPGVQLISYAYNPAGGVFFYTDAGDIEADFAAAQNIRGADIANVSLGANLYKNYLSDPNRCTWMGNYGVSDVLIDQIVRGGNSAVGIGDKIIVAWAAGNERNSTYSCSNTYNSTAPGGGSKNPIHVGALNTNDNSMTTFSSWGPTDDGRLKPTIVSGGCQNGGDGGIKSTFPGGGYGVMCGTSMASPSVAGSIALMLQAYRLQYNTSANFYPSTAKALLIQSATDLGNAGPDYQFGYGLVNIQRAVDLINQRGFVQASLSAGGYHYYSTVVSSSATLLRVTLAWDDVESTANANPNLVNNLDLQLTAPDGTVWQPWVLNPASPATAATRGTDNRNNQEQVEVTSPAIGTWMVRVRGASVPSGPQAYSLACPGCRTISIGNCANTAAFPTSAASFLPMSEGPQPQVQPAAPAPEKEKLTPGEAWQQALEKGADPQAAEQARQMAEVEKTRSQGKVALEKLLHNLTGEAFTLAQEELKELIEREGPAVLPATGLVDEGPGNPDPLPVITLPVDPAEGKGGGIAPPASGPSLAPMADLTVGPGCTYATIAAAITAASPGDRLRLAGNVTFNERITIGKALTIEGGYNGCTSGSTARSLINGQSGGTVVTSTGVAVTLKNLIIYGGNTAFEGGGIQFGWGAASTGVLALDNVEVRNNTAQWGGGIWLGLNSQLNANNIQVHDNTATNIGGGIRSFGAWVTLTNATINLNTAANGGGGIYASLEDTYAPQISLSTTTIVRDNVSTSGTGLGGGLYLSGGSATLATGSDLYSNDAKRGGGAYLATASQLYVDGSTTDVYSNTATEAGAGVYAVGGSYVIMDNSAEISSNTAPTSGAFGGGAYLDGSYLYLYSGVINNNSSNGQGGGVSAWNSSYFYASASMTTCPTTPCVRIDGNTSSSGGGGIYLNGSSGTLEVAQVMNNTSVSGGGIFIYDSSLSAYSTLIARNDATSGSGDGVWVSQDATFTGSGVTVANNQSGGGSNGMAFYIYDASAAAKLSCSIVWNHTTSLSSASQNVDNSDIQGGYAGSGNLNVNPSFVDSGGSNFHLNSGSPVLDMCSSGPGLDIDLQHRPMIRTNPGEPWDMGADELPPSGSARVGINGSSCAYTTIQDAVKAVSAGGTVYVSGGVYFENVDINKNVTIWGGRNSSCTSTAGSTTRVEGANWGGSVFDIYGSSPTITLRDMEVLWGSGIGAGVDAMGGTVTLNNVDLYNNHASNGALYVAGGATVTATNGSTIHNNTATSDGGGVRVWGTFNAPDMNSDIYSNCAENGGGLAINGGHATLDNADVYENVAVAAEGKGGGVYVLGGGSFSGVNSAWVGTGASAGNSAYNGGGIYADASTVTLSNLSMQGNDALNNGGGIYLANGSTLNATTVNLGAPAAGNQAVTGGGLFASGSSAAFTGGKIQDNAAAHAGGGVYTSGGTLTITGTLVGGTATNEPNRLTAAGYKFGTGLYLDGGVTATLAGGGRIAGHSAPDAGDGRGAGVYVNGSTFTVNASQIDHNTAGYSGGGIRLFGTSTLHLLNSAILDYNTAQNADGGAVAAGGTPTVTLASSTLQHNTAQTNGGGISISAGTLDLSGSFDVRWNNANAGYGGGIAVTGTADLDIVASGSATSYFGVNWAGLGGGGIYVANTDVVYIQAIAGQKLAFNTNTTSGNGGGLYANAGAYLDLQGNIEATSNQAAGNGGFAYLAGDSTFHIDDYLDVKPQVWVNEANNGGAIYATGSNVYCDGAVFGADANGNKATAGNGGAIYFNGGILTSGNCTFRNNWATADGGAIYIASGTAYIEANMIGSLVVQGGPASTPCSGGTECSSFHHNKADSDTVGGGSGGAIYLAAGTLNVSQTYFYNNQAYSGGGAIYQAGGTATVNNSLLHHNSVSMAYGSGIRANAGTVTVTHATLSDNTGGSDVSAADAATSTVTNTIAYSNYVQSLASIDTTSCNIIYAGSGGTITNPQFVGGGNYRLKGTSPAINLCASGLARDLDNFHRPVRTLYDAGAYEFPYGFYYVPIIEK